MQDMYGSGASLQYLNLPKQFVWLHAFPCCPRALPLTNCLYEDPEATVCMYYKYIYVLSVYSISRKKNFDTAGK